MTAELLNTLYVQTPGADLRLDQDTVRITMPEKPGRTKLPLRRIDGIVVYGHVHLSTDLLARCAQDKRSVTWMSRAGRFRARLDTGSAGNVLLRHDQHLVHAAPDRRLDVARAMVAGKLHNSRQVLLRAARDAQTTARTALRAAAAETARGIEELPDAEQLNTVRGIEGQAANVYFGAMPHLLRPADGIPAFRARTRRPPTDPANAVFSFCYGLLRSMVHGAAEQVGLDPYIGFLHGIRPGKPGLALDVMEEFRAPLADRLALTLFNRRQLRPEHFEELPGGAVRLTEDGRKIVLTAWQEAREEEWEHPLAGRSVAAGLLPVVQCRILARHIRDELPGYVPWRSA